MNTKQKISSLILSACIGSCLFNTNIVNAQDINSTPNSNTKENIMENSTIPKEMVKITKQPLNQEKVIVNKSTKNIVTADKDATDKTKELISYLREIAKQDKFIFGHQNDVINSVQPNMLIENASNELSTSHNSSEEISSIQRNLNSPTAQSNSKDLTGSIAGMFGIDTLALAGDELHIKDPQKALNASIDVSLKAAKEGALITLSTHMPNFSSKNIKKLSNGKYDFTACSFADCGNFNGTVQDIMPNGKYNAEFTAYLDMIADYGLALQNENIPVLFRPFHENGGSWFWWGGEHLTPQESIDLYKYTADYLKNKGVHNFIYVYSPNGPVTDEKTYMSRYPGDDYVDILAFDFYDDYNEYPAKFKEDFFKNLDKSCPTLTKIADKHNKIPAIAEAGMRIMKSDKSGNDGFLKENNPILGHNWYKKVGKIALKNDMPYFLLWANFSPYNCYIPYKYNDDYGHELSDEFIEFYNWDKSVFANEVNFY